MTDQNADHVEAAIPFEGISDDDLVTIRAISLHCIKTAREAKRPGLEQFFYSISEAIRAVGMARLGMDPTGGTTETVN